MGGDRIFLQIKVKKNKMMAPSAFNSMHATPHSKSVLTPSKYRSWKYKG